MRVLRLGFGYLRLRDFCGDLLFQVGLGVVAVVAGKDGGHLHVRMIELAMATLAAWNLKKSGFLRSLIRSRIFRGTVKLCSKGDLSQEEGAQKEIF